MSRVLELYRRANRVPALGRGAFSLAFALKAPYFNHLGTERSGGTVVVTGTIEVHTSNPRH